MSAKHVNIDECECVETILFYRPDKILGGVGKIGTARI